MKFGNYPDLTLSSAQTRRTECLNLLAMDIDPIEEREKEEQQSKVALSSTLEIIAAQWFEIKKTKVTTDFANDIWRSLELHIFPRLGKRPISKLDAPIVIEVIKPVAARGNLETVKRLCQRLNEIMTYAVNTGVIHHNPLAGIKASFAVPVKRHNPTITPDELPILMSKLNYARINLITRAKIEWQLHTMTRPGETAKARWEQFDLENKTWTIEPEGMKKGRLHTIPLTKQTVALLDLLRPISGHLEHVFPNSRNPRTHAHTESSNVALKRMGFKDILTSHGIRSIASTALNEHGFDPDLVEKALSHIDPNETRRSYNRAEYMNRRREMMAWWSEYIEKAASGNMSMSASIEQGEAK